MTPRQEAAAARKLQKLYAQRRRALAPVQKKLRANAEVIGRRRASLEKKHIKESVALDKAAHRIQNGPIQREKKIEAKFDKKINALLRKK